MSYESDVLRAVSDLKAREIQSRYGGVVKSLKGNVRD